MCGDSSSAGDCAALFGKSKPRLIFTDPPYSVNYQSKKGNSYSKGRFAGPAVFNDDKDGQEAQKFYQDVLANLYAFSSPDASLYWWYANNKREIENRLAFSEAGWHSSQVIIWLKEQMIFSLGQDYHRVYEPCLFGWKQGRQHFSNRKWANAKDVFSLEMEDFSEIIDLWYQRRDRTNEYVHPTQKPVRLAERAIKKNSMPGDIVADVFGGSGSTLIACDQMKRRCFMMELDPKFCDVIINRYAKFTETDPDVIFESAEKREAVAK